MKLAAVLALVATWAFFYEYAPPFQRVHLFSDIEYYHWPMQQYAFRALKEGRIPQWDPSMYCGISFAGNTQVALFYPPAWLMFAASWRLPRLSFKMLEYFAFAHLWLAFLLCYGWLRSRRLDNLACALGAGVFAYGGYMVAQIIHLGAESGLTWMPLALWGIDDAVERRDWRPLWKTAMASAMCFLAGYPPVWVVLCAVTFLYALLSRLHWRAALGTCAAIAASLLLAMIQLLPAFQASSFMVIDEKYGGGPHTWRVLIPFFVPNWFDFNPGSTFAGIPDGTMYIYGGLATLFAILWAIGRHKFRPYLQIVVVSIFCLIWATNPYFWPYRAMKVIPFLIRIAQSYNFYAGIALMAALFTALSLNDYLESAPKKGAPRWQMPIAAALLAGWSIRLLWVAGHGGMFAAGWIALAQTAVALALFSFAIWVLRAESGTRRKVLAAAALLAAGADYKAFGVNRMFNTLEGDVDKKEAVYSYGIGGVNPIADEALRTNRNYRIANDEAGAPNVTDYRRWGLASPQGFDPFLTTQYHEVIERWVRFYSNREFHVNPESREMMQSLGARYVITHGGVGKDPQLAVSPNYRLVGTDDSFYRIYEYQHAQPPYGWEDGSGEVQPTGWMPERRTFHARSERGGRFFFVEQFYPGWHATVDGHPSPIERWNGTFQAIRVGPGEHTIVFEYRERYLLLGAAVSLASIVVLIVAVRMGK